MAHATNKRTQQQASKDKIAALRSRLPLRVGGGEVASQRAAFRVVRVASRGSAVPFVDKLLRPLDPRGERGGGGEGACPFYEVNQGAAVFDILVTVRPVKHPTCHPPIARQP